MSIIFRSPWMTKQFGFYETPTGTWAGLCIREVHRLSTLPKTATKIQIVVASTAPTDVPAFLITPISVRGVGTIRVRGIKDAYLADAITRAICRRMKKRNLKKAWGWLEWE